MANTKYSKLNTPKLFEAADALLNMPEQEWMGKNEMIEELVDRLRLAEQNLQKHVERMERMERNIAINTGRVKR